MTPALISVSSTSMTLSPPPQPAHSADYALWTLLTLKKALPLKFTNLSIPSLYTNSFLPYFLVPSSLGTSVFISFLSSSLSPYLSWVPRSTPYSPLLPLFNNQTSKSCRLSFISRLLFCFIVVCFKPCHVACGTSPTRDQTFSLQWKHRAVTLDHQESPFSSTSKLLFCHYHYTALLVLLPVIILYLGCITISPRSRPVLKLLTKTTSDFSVTKTSRQVSVLCASDLFLLPVILLFPT